MDDPDATRETRGGDDSLLKAVLGMTVTSPPVTLTGGEVIDGAYRIERRLGSGGMAVVYLARDLRLHRDVAIKLHPTPGGESGAERLVREAQTMAQLVHPNIATIHEAGTWNGHPFVAIEYVDGGTARTWAEQARRTPREILELYLAAGRGLAAAHKAGVVHRDFKPDNVLVGTDGRVRVADFGIARAYDGVLVTGDGTTSTVTKPGATVGTPAYMAPEQRDSAAVGPAADQYAYAVALWEALDGKRPGPRRESARIPRDVARQLRRALATDPSARFPTMNELLSALQRGVAAPRRRRLTVAALAVTALAGTGGYLGLAGDETRDDPCRGAGDAIDSAWTADHRAAMQTAFVATSRPFAQTAFERAAERLDAYATAWRTARIEACHAAEIGELDADQHARADRCLDRRRAGLAALVRTFTTAVSSSIVDRSIDLVYALPSVADCADPTRIAAEPALPDDPAERAELAAIEDAEREVELLFRTGRFEESLALARDVVSRADALGATRLAAEARVYLGTAQSQIGDPAEARTTLETAARLAAEAGDDHLAARAWSSLLQLLVLRQRDVVEAERFLPVVEAAVARTSPSSQRHLDLDSLVGSLRLEQGRPAEALAALERSLANRKAAMPAGDPRIAIIEMRLAFAYEDVGRPDDARAAYRRSEQIYLDAYGPDHTAVATVRSNLALLLMNQGELEEARALLVAVIASRERLVGAEHGSLQAPLSNLGEVLVRMERGAEARLHYERALAIGTAANGPDHPDVARDEARLGELLAAQGERGRARELLTHALRVFEKAQGADGTMTKKVRASLERSAGDR
jgi:eukaryotic-like serine/threonine-protein kinase